MAVSVFIACCQPLPLDGTLLSVSQDSGVVGAPRRENSFERCCGIPPQEGHSVLRWCGGGCPTCEHWLCKLRWLRRAPSTSISFSISFFLPLKKEMPGWTVVCCHYSNIQCYYHYQIYNVATVIQIYNEFEL